MLLGEILYETGGHEGGLAGLERALERAVEIVPADPPSPERAYALASLAGGRMVAWRYAESLPLSEEAFGLARQVSSPPARLAPRQASPLRQAHAAAVHIGAGPLLREVEMLAQRARLSLVGPDTGPASATQSAEETLGLTAREAEVLALIARGCTNREIAATLVISVKTASVHVSHILHKLGVPNRIEAAAIAHRVAPR